MADYNSFCARFGLDPWSQDARFQYQKAQDALHALHTAAAKAETFAAIEGARDSAPAPPGNRQWLRSQIMSLATELHDRSGKSSADHETYALLRQAAGLQEDQIQKEALSHERTV